MYFRMQCHYTLLEIVYKNILPLFNEKIHVDFTGKLFNTLNAWVKVPDGNQNDVVLTPRYVCEMMARLCKVNKDSFVWDYALGSAGFLIAAMKQMIADAEEKLAGDPSARDRKIRDIKAKQLLGIEKLPDIYMLAVLNMLLMNEFFLKNFRQKIKLLQSHLLCCMNQ